MSLAGHAPRALRDRRAARRGRHGRGLPGAGHAARSRRRGQGPVRRRSPASPEARQRFEREARTISQLSHPHICALYDVGDANGGDRVTSSWSCLEGETLAGPAGEGRRSRSSRRCATAIEIADALDKAHRAGHRAPRPQAGQRDADEGGREAARLRPGEGDRRRRRPVERARRCRPTRRRADRARARSSARSSTWRRSSSRAARPTRAATSSRSARCSTRWRRASAMFGDRLRQPLSPVDARSDRGRRVSRAIRMIAGSRRTTSGCSSPRWRTPTAPSAATPQRTRAGRGWLPWVAIVLRRRRRRRRRDVVAPAGPGTRRATPHAVRFAIPPPADGAFYEYFENTGLSRRPPTASQHRLHGAQRRGAVPDLDAACRRAERAGRSPAPRAPRRCSGLPTAARSRSSRRQQTDAGSICRSGAAGVHLRRPRGHRVFRHLGRGRPDSVLVDRRRGHLDRVPAARRHADGGDEARSGAR